MNTFLDINALAQMTPHADEFYTDWSRFQAEWPARMCNSADRAFIAYTLGEGSREEFEQARAMADDACHNSMPSIKFWRHGNPRGTFPSWFAKRLDRAMGPERFNHYRSPPGWDIEWLLNAGTTKAHVPTVISTQAGSEVVYSEQRVFGFELCRPWVFDRTKQEQPRRMRQVFLETLTRVLRGPQYFAYHTRCDLVLQRMSHRGWGCMRVVFMPWNFNEPLEATPNTMVLNNCKCLACNRRKARLNGYAVPRSDMDYLDANGNRKTTYSPRTLQESR